MPDPGRSAPRNILRDDDPAAPPAITHTTEAVIALLARACRATCGELGDDGKLEAARLFFTTAIITLRELDPKADAIVRRLAHDRLRVVAREHPAALTLREDPGDPWHAHYLLLSSEIVLMTYVGRAIARHKGDGTASGPNPDMIPLSRAIMPRD
jgi:hypothetical protein